MIAFDLDILAAAFVLWKIPGKGIRKRRSHWKGKDYKRGEWSRERDIGGDSQVGARRKRKKKMEEDNWKVI